MSYHIRDMFSAVVSAACAVLTAEFLTFSFAAAEFQPSALWIFNRFLDSAAQTQGTALFIGFLAFYWLARQARRAAGQRPAGIRAFHAVLSLLFAAAVCLGRSYSLLKSWDLIFSDAGTVCLGAVFFAAAAFSAWHALLFFDALLCAEMPHAAASQRKYRHPASAVQEQAASTAPCTDASSAAIVQTPSSAASSAADEVEKSPSSAAENPQPSAAAGTSAQSDVSAPPRQKSLGKFLARAFQTRFRRSFAAFFAVSAFYLLFFYPGSGTADTLYQLSQWLGVIPMNSRHPVPATLLMGSFLSIGSFLGDQNIGIFLYHLMQILFQSFVFAQCTETICGLTSSRTLRWSAFLWLLLNPLFPSWGITCVKDTLYSAGVLWLICCLVRIQTHLCRPRSHIFLQLLCAALVVMFFRLNGIITAAVTLLISAVCLLKRRSDVLRVLGSAALTLLAGAGLIFTLQAENIAMPWREAFSLPLQQTARVVWAGREIQPADLTELKSLFHNRDLRRIYDPVLAAPVKWAWGEEEAPFSDWLRFLRLWRRLGKQYPADYVQAALNSAYGYFFPGAAAVEDQSSLPDFIPHERLHGIRLFLNRTGWPAAQKAILLWHKAVKSLPVTSLVYSCAFYVWTVLFLTGTALFRKKYAVLLPAVPLLLTIAACLAAPIGSCLRYLLPAAASLPLLTICVIRELHTSTPEAQKKTEKTADGAVPSELQKA
jgi:hypothetical protein